MSQKYIAVFAYILRNPEPRDPPICYGYAFCKRDTYTAANEVAEYRCRRLKADLIGLWSCEWNKPNAPYVELYRDTKKHPSDKPAQDLARLLRTGDRGDTTPTADNVTVVPLKPRIRAKAPETPLYEPPYTITPAVFREEIIDNAAAT